jgi:hypothetical protein
MRMDEINIWFQVRVLAGPPLSPHAPEGAPHGRRSRRVALLQEGPIVVVVRYSSLGPPIPRPTASWNAPGIR